MSAVNPRFWSQPTRFIRWAARERPGAFWSVAIGAMGPVCFVVGPPFRRLIGDEDPPAIPMTYPVPSGPRKQLTGFDDDVNDK